MMRKPLFPTWTTSPAMLSTTKSSFTADGLVLRLQHDLVVGGVGNRAARGQRDQARVAPAAPGGEAFGEHAHDVGEIGALLGRVRPSAAALRQQGVLVPRVIHKVG
jgi:hypothetical protein